MPTASLNGIDCHYALDSFGQKETIVFSHSLGADLAMWERQVDILSRHFNTLRYDTRGHGKSGIPANPADVAALGSDVLALLDHLKLAQPVTFCGLSLGGLIGQWLGINAPRRLKNLIISNTAAKIGNDATWNQRIDAVTRNGLAPLRDPTGERWFTEKFRQEQPDIVANILTRFVQTDPQGYARCCSAVRDADFREQLSKLEVSTLIISADQDPVTTTADAQFMAQRIPAARHATLHAAHLSAVENPNEYAKLILFHTALTPRITPAPAPAAPPRD